MPFGLPCFFSDLQAPAATFDNRAETIAKGITLGSRHYEVHKWYGDHAPPLAYGREKAVKADGKVDEASEGIAVAKGAGGRFVVVCYALPVLSALAVA
eukprot:CAMPEP_0174897468 /NCGR_PEP_ID=MMETSP0167-20121228/14122_1 /TAXON_ID=38298 /ORGANISM="Rhodella maculata, Strain CCMP736" /LENGTH=97 /DNA_ID=CAMNT_0016137473 /DNA_START=73 /DNA_END=363 /DNA_ORIENTATION=+